MSKNSINHRKNSTSDNKDSLFGKNDDFFTKSSHGIIMNYLKKQSSYFMLSGIIPLFCIIIAGLDAGFIIKLFINNKIVIKRFIDAFIPIYIFIILAILMVIQYKFISIWQKKIKKYDSVQFQQENNIRNKNSLTEIFYDIINYHEGLKITFTILNMVVAVYLIWALDFFYIGIPMSISRIILRRIIVVNLISYVSIIAYMVIQWRHFLTWNKKIKRIKQFERQIYDELNLDDL